MKIRPVEVELFHADRSRKELTKPIVAFRIFFFANTRNWIGIKKEKLTACSNIDPISSFILLSRIFLL
jgi:hypothetical protein